MEDYEKKYKDALAIVKSYYGRTQLSSVHDAKEELNTLERAFPELKAVKSERVKEDIKYILANTDLSKVPSSFSDMLEWIDNREDKAELLDGEDYGIDGLYHAISILEKTLGEVEGYQSDDGILDHKIAIDSVKELYSKRPKWSGEDADNLEEIIMFCDTLAGGEMYKLTNEQLKSISKTLKAIKKGTVSPTKKEWSEEDESRMDNLCHFLEEYGDQYYGGLTLKSIINWIKSLRYQNMWISVDEEVYVEDPVLAQKKDKSDPFKGYVVCCDHTLVPNVYERYMILSNIVSQSTWKPSDEQMKALGIAIRSGIQLGTWEEDALKSLAEQLKKLSEE